MRQVFGELLGRPGDRSGERELYRIVAGWPIAVRDTLMAITPTPDQSDYCSLLVALFSGGDDVARRRFALRLLVARGPKRVQGYLAQLAQAKLPAAVKSEVLWWLDRAPRPSKDQMH